MRIRHRLCYDATPSAVYEMRANPAFRHRVCEAMGTVSHEVSVDDNGDTLVVVVDMVEHTQGIPSVARRIVGDETRVVQTERWDGIETGDIEVEIPGKPGHIRGRLQLQADGGGSVYVFDGEARINIPFVAGRLEGLIEKLFVEGMDTEQRVAAAWLKGDR